MQNYGSYFEERIRERFLAELYVFVLKEISDSAKVIASWQLISEL